MGPEMSTKVGCVLSSSSCPARAGGFKTPLGCVCFFQAGEDKEHGGVRRRMALLSPCDSVHHTKAAAAHLSYRVWKLSGACQKNSGVSSTLRQGAERGTVCEGVLHCLVPMRLCVTRWLRRAC